MNPKGKKFVLFTTIGLLSVAGLLFLSTQTLAKETLPTTAQMAPEILGEAGKAIAAQIFGACLAFLAACIPLAKTLQRKPITKDIKKTIVFLSSIGIFCAIMGALMLSGSKQTEEALSLWKQGGKPTILHMTNLENPEKSIALVRIQPIRPNQQKRTVVLPSLTLERLLGEMENSQKHN